MSGKIANVSPGISEIQQGLNGSCVPQDLETMMQMVFLYFNAPRKDETAFMSLMEKQKGFLQNKSSDPNSIFRDSISYTMSGYHYRSRPFSVETLKEISLDRAFQIYKERFSDASGFTFFFVGNFNVNEIKPMIERYIGGLPSPKRNESWKDLNIIPPKGIVEKIIKKGIEPKSSVSMKFTLPFVYNRVNRSQLNALTKLTSIKLRESLREEKSGVYGVSFQANPKHYPKQALELTISFSCSPSNVDSLVAAALKVIESIKQEGCNEKDLLKIKELSIRERELSLKENSFWIGVLNANYMNNENILDLMEFNNFINALQGSDFKKYANDYLKTDNYARFILMPE